MKGEIFFSVVLWIDAESANLYPPFYVLQIGFFHLRESRHKTNFKYMSISGQSTFIYYTVFSNTFTFSSAFSLLLPWVVLVFAPVHGCICRSFSFRRITTLFLVRLVFEMYRLSSRPYTYNSALFNCFAYRKEQSFASRFKLCFLASNCFWLGLNKPWTSSAFIRASCSFF